MGKKQDHGTAFNLGQFAEAGAAIHRALPKALAGLDPKKVLKAVKRGEELEQVLASALQTFLANGQQTASAAPTPASAPVIPEPTITSFTIVADYGPIVEKLVKAGRYDWVNDNITQRNFPHDRKAGKHDREVVAVHFNRPMGSDEVVAEFDRLGLRPADSVEELSFGAQHPDVQRGFPVVALGSSWVSPGGARDVLVLGRHGADRRLYLGWWGHDWREDCRFLAVRK